MNKPNEENKEEPKKDIPAAEQTPEAPKAEQPKAEPAKVEPAVSEEVKAEAAVEKTDAPAESKPAEKDAKASTDNSNDRKQRSGGPQGRGRKPKRRDNRSDNQDDDAPEFMEKVISIKRITKVTKGGKKLSFSALVVVGDMKGNVGYSLSKASEVSSAIRKAMGVAKKNMIQVPLRGTTITHEIIGQCSGSRVLLKPASDGTGVIASGPVRAVCDGAGIHNILTKCHRSNNPINVVKAAIDGLSRLKTSLN